MHPVRAVDRLLNGITMYRLMIYVLTLLLLASVLFAWLDVISISALGLVLSTAVLISVSYITNTLASWISRTPTSTESWLITALILACIMPPSTQLARLGWTALAVVVAIVGKFLARPYSNMTLNPAAAGALVVGLLGVVPITWWIGAPPLFPLMLILGLLVLRKTRQFELFGCFVIGSALIMLLVTGLQGQPLIEGLRTLLLSYPLLFLGTIMLTEPSTMPAGKHYIWMYGLIVGALFSSQLHFGRLATTPHMALIIGNVFSYIVTAKYNYRLRLTGRSELAPNLYELTFKLPVGRSLRFRPGQYMEWTLPQEHSRIVDRRGNRRTFSIASAPSETEVKMGIKYYQPSSSYKQSLLALKPGDVMQVGHVNGDFTLPFDNRKKLAFIAGGIGITPFRSMLKAIIDAGMQRDIILIYSAQAGEHVYQDIFKLAEKYGAKTHLTTERTDTKLITDYIPDVRDRSVYISGPNVMVQGIKRDLIASGQSRKLIKTDYFTGY